MSDMEKTITTTGRAPDLLISGVSALIFAAALLATLGWPIEAARFPRFITSVGLFCCLAFITFKLVPRSKLSAGKPSRDHFDTSEVDGSPEDDTDSEPEDVGYVFATAGRDAWVRTLSWIALFFILTFVLGVYTAGVAFAVMYLRFGASKGWLFSTIYALLLGVVLWTLFDYFLELPLPRGLVGSF